MGSEQHRFPQQERQKRWGGCLEALSCFGSQKGGKRIVPSSRIPEGNASAPQQNGAQPVANQATSLHPSLLAPPSSPASFSNSALPSTAQSPSCFMSANSPGDPSMFATGPYAHETQLVSPPVFSAFTTEPSTAPFTPPPELAHITTPSSPDVPYARFLTSSMNLKGTVKTSYNNSNDLQATYSLYPGSPASCLRSPNCLSSSFPERPQWDHPSIYPQSKNVSRTGSGRLFDNEHNGVSMVSPDSNFFCPATFAQFYQDTALPAGGRLSVSNDSDVNPNQNRPNRSPKQDIEELDAYRASFGFSADEIKTTTQYVEITDVMDDSFTMTTPFTSEKSAPGSDVQKDVQKAHGTHTNLLSNKDCKSSRQTGHVYGSRPVDYVRADEDIFSKMGLSRTSRKYMSSSDAEVEYRRGRSLREGKAWDK